jgi:hypothetical protein
MSYITTKLQRFPFFIFGAFISAVLFAKYLLKALITAPKSANIGNIIPHIFAFKVGALFLHPTYMEYINFCSGFMFVDFPWLNKFFGTYLSDPRDKSPNIYSFFYTNMNIASTYLLALFVIIFFTVIGLIISKSCRLKYNRKI